MKSNPSFDNFAISAKNISKVYKLYKDPFDRLKESLNPLKKKYHKDFYALDNFSMVVKKGEIIGIIGKNGSGKSTLLKVLAGVLTPSSGSYHVDGKISALLELGSGFNPERTGLQNVYINGAINGFCAKEMEHKSQDIIEFADIGEFIHQPVKTYSSGMRARLAFGVAIHIDPMILIIDEILSVGDSAFQRKCFAKIEAFKKAGKTILFVSHSAAQIVELCDHAIWISRGQKIIEGNPKFVTGLYLKHSQKKNINIESIKTEYIELKLNKNDGNPDKKSNNTEQNDLIKSFFNPNLVSKSTIYYEEKGARISDVMITTLNGKKVNVLTQGEEYIYSYKVKFMNGFDDVKFGMLIKGKEGTMISGGGCSLSEEHIPQQFVIKNDVIIVKWKFQCLLNEGYYFFNAGVKNSMKGDFLHRIVDAIIVRVIKTDKLIRTGFCLLIKESQTFYEEKSGNW
jgi:homopolymeric O-antigen transport system ATP-binding protein